MHPKDHPIFKHGNLFELFVQSPYWVFFYGTGLVFVLEMFSWVLYGLGLNFHPKTHPLPHVFVLDFLSEFMRWIRCESGWGRVARWFWLSILAVVGLVFVPFVFVYYFKFIFWFWFDEQGSGIGELLKISQSLI